MKKVLAAILVVSVVFSLFGMTASAKPVYRLDGLCRDYAELMENATYDFTLGSISAKYESNGNPATISGGSDSGGVSYGAYQFSSKAGVPLTFANWCIYSGEGIVTGTRLVAAYRLDEQSYSTHFNTEWTNIASEDSQGFLVLQHKYVKAQFYDVMVSKLSARYSDFNIENYSMALKNVIWSRAVQHGVNSSVLFDAIDGLGGVSGRTEEELIRAMYARSASIVSAAPSASSIPITAASAAKYGMDSALLSGRYMRYFSRNSSDIQVSVFRRLTVNEPKDVFALYTASTGRPVSNTTVTPEVETNQGEGGTGSDPVDPGTTGSDPADSPLVSFFKTVLSFLEMISTFFTEMINLITSLISGAAAA